MPTMHNAHVYDIDDYRSEEESVEDIVETQQGLSQDVSGRTNNVMNLYNKNFLAPLNRAFRQDQVISKDSYNEWLTWVDERSNGLQDLDSSTWSALPDYLQKRYTLAHKRDRVLNNSDCKALQNSSDPKLKALHTKLADDDYFFNAISYDQRNILIVDVLNTLPIAKEEEVIFKKLTAQLDKAIVDKVISSDSRKKWIARFKDPAVSAQARIYFVSSQFPSYVSAWYAIKEEWKNVKAQKDVEALTAKDIKEIDILRNENAFTALHHNEKKNVLAKVRAAATAKKNGTEHMLQEASAVLSSAVGARIMSKSKVGEWMEMITKGIKTVQELKSYKERWKHAKRGYEEVEFLMLENGAPYGFNRLSEQQFLLLSTAQRESYVEMARQRMRDERTESPTSLFTDKKAKVRHSFDVKNWEEARMYLDQAWKVASREEEREELRTMERFLVQFGKESTAQDTSVDRQKEIANAQRAISTSLSQMPSAARPFFEKSLSYGADATWCTGVMFYNVKWCLDRNFLPQDLTIIRDEAMVETPERVRPGGGHKNGKENNRPDGFGMPAIREDGIGPQNICASKERADTLAKSANTHKYDWSYWYWNNLIVDGLSANDYNEIATVHRRKIVSAARKLDAHGLRYNPTYNLVGPSDPSVN